MNNSIIVLKSTLLSFVFYIRSVMYKKRNSIPNHIRLSRSSVSSLLFSTVIVWFDSCQWDFILKWLCYRLACGRVFRSFLLLIISITMSYSNRKYSITYVIHYITCLSMLWSYPLYLLHTYIELPSVCSSDRHTEALFISCIEAELSTIIVRSENKLR